MRGNSLLDVHRLSVYDVICYVVIGGGMGRKKLTADEWVLAAKKVHGDKYLYSKSVYVRYGLPIVISCREHGDFTQRENNHRNGNGCPRCGVDARQDKRSHGYDSFVKAAREAHGNTYEYPQQCVYNSRTKARIVCPVHGEFTQFVYTHIAGQGCRKCGYERNGKRSQLGVSEFLSRAKVVHGDTYEYLSGLSGLHKNMSIRCQVHGVFKQTPHNHLAGAGCPKCVGRVSRGEQEIANFVASLGLKTRCGDRSEIAPFEIDVYVPDKRVGIEFNGLWFHRESLVGGKTREKWERSNAVGIKLVQVFEDEWAQRRTQVESRLRAILGVADKYYARRCEVVRLNADVTRAFLERYHIQGAGATISASYGLELGGRVVAVATFGKGRFKNAGWELLRYASEGRVLGGISRLVSAFRRENPDGQLVSYADLRWGDGEAYRAAGFRLDSVTEPDYWWADVGKCVRYPRYALQPHKVGMPEKEYAAAKKLVKIVGVGHKKWVLDSAAP